MQGKLKVNCVNIQYVEAVFYVIYVSQVVVRLEKKQLNCKRLSQAVLREGMWEVIAG